jgi:hypothetical protein
MLIGSNCNRAGFEFGVLFECRFVAFVEFGAPLRDELLNISLVAKLSLFESARLDCD